MNSARRPRLAFVSPSFLFPNDAGGKIRSTNILRGLRGGAFDITLLAPAEPVLVQQWQREIDSVCDEFVAWAPTPPMPRWRRAADLLDALPVNVVADRKPAAKRAVHSRLLRGDIDVVVFDFVHAAVLRPDRVDAATVCFTHNVEAEIFARHAQTANGPFGRWMWSSQHRKMVSFERCVLAGFDKVVAVSERDAKRFQADYGLLNTAAIPTGVDLDFFSWQPPAIAQPPTVIFTGSMDWDANVNGVAYFLQHVWPRVKEQVPACRFFIVGRHPPVSLQAMARASADVEVTGFVDDVRPFAHRAQVFVIPLLVGGGTRIKAFEAMAMGCPVVSTALGMEGLGAVDGEHFLERDDPVAMADAVVELLADQGLRDGLSRRARALVEGRFGHRVASAKFEAICLDALALSRARQERAQ